MPNGTIEPAAVRDEPWVPRFIAALCEYKQRGLEFEFAWRIALRRHPPRIIELGARDDTGALERYHGVCMAAWFDQPRADGGPSRLRGLNEALEGGFLPQEVEGVRRIRPRRVQV